MIWLLFKKCNKKKSKLYSFNETNEQDVNDSRTIIQELLLEFNEFYDLEKCNDMVFVTDSQFNSLSIINTNHEINGAISEIIEICPNAVENSIITETGDTDDSMDTFMLSNRFSIVTQKHLKSLQCPFSWDLDPCKWTKQTVNCIENKYGKYNTNLSSMTFSFNRYISNLIISFGLFKTNEVERAHDILIDIWKWLDKLDDSNESFYLDIRNGLKHVVMSTLCHILYSLNRNKCQQLFEMIVRFNNLNTKSRATVYATQAAIYIDIGGKLLQKAVENAKYACDLDSDTAYWYYIYSIAMTAQRQYQYSCKSTPTVAEFDAIQHAIILAHEPNPYFNFHRMNLMNNKILYHYYFNNSNAIINGSSAEKIKQDFRNIIELIKAIVCMELEDPHLIVDCVKSLMNLSYFNLDNIDLIKQISELTINNAFTDLTVIQAMNENLKNYKKLTDNYKEIVEKKMHSESTDTLNHVNQYNNVAHVDNDLENEFNLIVKKHKTDNDLSLDFNNLLNKYDGDNRWKILAQFCSYTILFRNFKNFKNSVEQFMMLINDRTIANSEIVMIHRSIFIKDQSIVINLAELMCNEIKLFIAFGHTKNADKIQFYLDQLTTITEMCQLKSKKADPSMKSELLKFCKEEQQNVSQEINVVQRNDLKQVVLKYHNKQRVSKQTPNNNMKAFRSRAKRRNR